MYTFFSFLTKIFPFLVVPYTVVLMIIIAYFIHKKWKVVVAIKNVPITTIFPIKLSKVKKNLQISSLVYNFIIFLSVSELFDNVIWGIANVCIYDILSNDKPVNISEYCTIRDGDLLGLFVINSYSSIAHHLMNFGLVMTSLLPTVMCLLIIVLRRLYLNVPYIKWVRGYSTFIIIRLIVFLVLTWFVETWYFSQLLYLPFGCVDVYVYVVSSKKFYLLLKGRRDEAKFHFTRSEYRKRAMIVKRYFYGQIFTGFFFSLLFLNCFLTFIDVPLKIAYYNPCFLNYISFGFIPDFKLSQYYNHLATEFDNIIYIIQLVCVGIIEVSVFLAYLILCFIILIKLFVKQYNFKYVNEWITKPLMEQYRNDVESHRGNRVQRPPFIQDIRSH